MLLHKNLWSVCFSGSGSFCPFEQQLAHLRVFCGEFIDFLRNLLVLGCLIPFRPNHSITFFICSFQLCTQVVVGFLRRVVYDFKTLASVSTVPNAKTTV